MPPRPRRRKQGSDNPEVAAQVADEQINDEDNEHMEVDESPIETLTRLVQACHKDKALNADVTRLYKARTLLEQIDWTGAGCRGLIILLQACVRGRIFYRTQFGPQVIAAILSAHPALVSLAIKSLVWAVRHFSEGQVKNAGVALYKAWKESNAGCQILLETSIQKFMTCALFKSPLFAKRSRLVLKEFHVNRSDPSVDELLCRLYQPILWRHLKVANWRVRRNGILLLQSAFPLITPESSSMEYDRQLGKQLQIFFEALTDPADHVRVSAIIAVCELLETMWAQIPPEFTAKYLQQLTECNAHDVNSMESRSSVALGLSQIISKNPLSHGVLPGVVAKLKTMLYDSEAKVRNSAVVMMEAAMNMPKFDIVNVFDHPHLFELAAVEQGHFLQTRELVPNFSKHSLERLAVIIGRPLFNKLDTAQLEDCRALAEEHAAGLYAVLYHYTDPTDGLRMKLKLATTLFIQLMKDLRINVNVQRLQSHLVAILALVDSCKSVVLNPKNDFEVQLSNFFYSQVDEVQLLEIAKSVPLSMPLILDILILIDPQQMTRKEVFHKLVRSLSTSETPPGLIRLGSAWDLLGELKELFKRLEVAASEGSLKDGNKTRSAVKMLQAILLLDNPNDTAVIFPVAEKCLRIFGERMPGIAGKFTSDLLIEFLDTLFSAMHSSEQTAPWSAFLSALEKSKPGPAENMVAVVNCFLPHLALACFLHKDGGVSEKLGSAMSLFWRWSGDEVETWKCVLNYLQALIDFQLPESVVLEALSHCVQWVTVEAPTESDFTSVASSLVKYFDYSPAFKRFLSSPISGEGDRLREWLNGVVESKKKRETSRPIENVIFADA